MPESASDKNYNIVFAYINFRTVNNDANTLTNGHDTLA